MYKLLTMSSLCGAFKCGPASEPLIRHLHMNNIFHSSDSRDFLEKQFPFFYSMSHVHFRI